MASVMAAQGIQTGPGHLRVRMLKSEQHALGEFRLVLGLHSRQLSRVIYDQLTKEHVEGLVY
eukprot:CAMPEP_0185270596 /NCGR_PEP_ID=MMETSP1359-20130426/42633_1 /TAXON_ID=552665 /ORGANISM="Bigelowiella longifila, Strain CCMP242" /LENGTH=61 /DNA_ID=CAMNT_0027862209 /DNA_START=369 /DNA_END=553 /DNA_ORIENTATION=+